MSDYIIRSMQKGEAEAHRMLRLNALKNNPEAFGSSYEESIEMPLDIFEQRIPEPDSENRLIVVEKEGRLLGMMAFIRETRMKQRHIGFIHGVYVEPEARGKGLARKMMEHIMAHVRQLDGLRNVQLSVVTSNTSALQLYQSFGFEIWGTEPEALKVGDTFYDEYHMLCYLTK